jgi:hypothetical protein
MHFFEEPVNGLICISALTDFRASGFHLSQKKSFQPPEQLINGVQARVILKVQFERSEDVSRIAPGKIS